MKKLATLLTILAVAFPLMAFGQENLLTHDSVSARTTGKWTAPSENLGARHVHHNIFWGVAHGKLRHRDEYKSPIHTVIISAYHPDGRMYARRVVHNLRTNAGADAQASQMAQFGAQVAACAFIAVSNDATAPAVTDTAVAGEITTNGLARAQGAYAHTVGTASFTVTKAFSVTGTQSSQKTGVLNASSGGTLCWEAAYSQINNNNGDTLTITWTVNY